jgi:glycerophosphoryl diester phosphodiesterase
MGAGRIECDATFTRDRELVCRHSQCDLHATTDILSRPELAAKCTRPFAPADPATGVEASAWCCTSDLTLAEFKTLCGRMDGVDPAATTVEAYLAGTPPWRTELYAGCGSVLSHAESIALIASLGADFVPELKAPWVPMPFEGEYRREDYAQQLIDEYRAAGIPPERVAPQSFALEDVLYWVEREPEYGRHAILLDDRPFTDPDFAPSAEDMRALAERGVRTLAPPLWVLLELDASGRIAPSAYARAARSAGLELVPWSLERSGSLRGGGGWYYQSVAPAIERDGDTLVVLDVLARQVGVQAVFSDWPATTTYYANCMDPGGTPRDRVSGDASR